MQAAPVTATSVRRVLGPSRRRLTLRRRRQWLGVLFAAPAVLVITVFFLVPLGLTFYMSLNDWSLLGAHSWTGLDNYTRAFKDPAQLKAILKEKKDLVARNLAEKLLTYALGRGLEWYDRRAVDTIVAGTAKGEYKFSALVVEIVRSDPFRLRRGKGEN